MSQPDMKTPPDDPPALLARRLVRGLDRAVLATSLDGWPYASLVMIATAPEGEPLLLISDLAQHTMNIAAEPRVSLLFDGTAGRDEPLTGPRVSLLGEARRVDDGRLLQRFVARHPSAGFYAGFGDFHLYRVTVERAHLVAGFGRIDWIAAADLLPAGLGALAEVEADIVRHMNEDHRDAVQLYAQVLLQRQGEGWVMTGVDAEGIDLRRGGEVARLDFAAPVHDAQGARAELVRLVAEARRKPA
jgi:putative heme iron utilization protein